MLYKMKSFAAYLTQNEFWHKLAKNVLIVFTGSSFASIMKLAGLFITLLILDKEDYGIFAISQNYMMFMDAFVNFQSWQGVIRYGSIAMSYKDEEQLCATIKMGLLIDGITCLVGTVAGLGLAEAAAVLFHWDRTTKLLCHIFCVEILFHMEGTITGILRLFDRFKYTVYYAVSYSLINFAAILLYYMAGGESVVEFACLYVATDIMKYIIYLLIGMYVLHREIGIQKIFKTTVRKVNPEHLRYTIWTNLTATFDVPIKYFDIFLLSFISNTSVASYKVYKQIVAVLGVMIGPISQVIMPQLSVLIARQKRVEAYRKVMELKKMLLRLLLPLSVAIIALSSFAFKYFKEGAYYGERYTLYMMLVMNAISFSYVGIHPLFSAYGFSKLSALITLTTNIGYIFLALVCVKYIGLSGIVFAVFVQFLWTVLLKQYFIKRNVIEGKQT